MTSQDFGTCDGRNEPDPAGCHASAEHISTVNISTWIHKGNSARQALHGAMLRLRNGRLDSKGVALSVGVGVFIGLLPVPGLQTFVWLGLVAILAIDPIITYACTWVSNPMTVLPFTLLEMELGSWVVTRHWLSITKVKNLTLMGMLRQGGHLMAGGLLLAAASGILAYCITRVITRRMLHTSPS